MDGHTGDRVIGVNTWVAYIGSAGKNVVEGDIAMLEPELQSGLKALQTSAVYACTGTFGGAAMASCSSAWEAGVQNSS